MSAPLEMFISGHRRDVSGVTASLTRFGFEWRYDMELRLTPFQKTVFIEELSLRLEDERVRQGHSLGKPLAIQYGSQVFKDEELFFLMSDISLNKRVDKKYGIVLFEELECAMHRFSSLGKHQKMISMKNSLKKLKESQQIILLGILLD